MDSSKEQLWIDAVERNLHPKAKYKTVSIKSGGLAWFKPFRKTAFDEDTIRMLQATGLQSKAPWPHAAPLPLHCDSLGKKKKKKKIPVNYFILLVMLAGCLLF